MRRDEVAVGMNVLIPTATEDGVVTAEVLVIPEGNSVLMLRELHSHEPEKLHGHVRFLPVRRVIGKVNEGL